MAPSLASTATPARPSAASSSAATAAGLAGIERLMAEALIARGEPVTDPSGDPGTVEYASWLRALGGASR